MCELYLVARGTSTAVVDGQVGVLSVGDLLVVERGEAHTFTSSSDDYLYFVVQAPFVPGHKRSTEWRIAAVRSLVCVSGTLALTRHSGQSGRLSLPARMCSTDMLLRPWSEADRDSIGAIVRVSRQEFDDWLPMLAPSLEDFDAYMETVRADEDCGVRWTYAVELDDAVVGQCTAELRDGNTVEIGYWVRTDRMGEGIATRAVRLLSASAANHFANVIIRCDAGNVRSAAVAGAAGFVHVSTVQLDPTIKGTSVQTGREMTWRLRVTA